MLVSSLALIAALVTVQALLVVKLADRLTEAPGTRDASPSLVDAVARAA